jgi:peptidyl-prolyl cis-trans isomerase SurA
MIQKALFLGLLFSTTQLFSQAPSKTATIFTVAGQPVTVGEFEYVYNKNNVNNQADYSEKSLTDYLNLYENFRLKVKEAEEIKLDTLSSLKNELEGYRKQLAKSYLTDREITEQLVQEAYNRSLQEVNASHILVKCDENANPADTLLAYKKAIELRKRILKGESFEKIAQENSDDPSAKQNKGEIGYFTVFQTVYPFETAAYTAKAGEVSQPVRTQFGYHLVKLNSARPAQGEIHVAHILLKYPEKVTDVEKGAIKKRIDSIYTEINKGTLTFDDAVLAFSDDRTSKNKKGELQWFGTGRMVPEFETAAFGLKKDGEISKPTSTAYGWHIIKRLEQRSVAPFSEVKNDFKKKVERDSRSAVAKTKLIERIKKDYSFSENPPARLNFYAAIDSSISKGGFNADSLKYNKESVIFVLASKLYTAQDFAKYIEKNGRRRNDKSKEGLLNEYYENFVNQKCLDQEESQLENKKPEFASLMREYRDGILLFELTDRKVWSNAVKDTVGLQKFHDDNKTKYMWGNRADVQIYNASDAKIANAAYKLAGKGKTPAEIQKKLNVANAKSKVSVLEGKYEKGQYDVVDKIEWKSGLTTLNKLNDSSYQFIFVKQIATPEPKSLKEAKGYVVSDYQEYLEKKWLSDLRQKYPITLNNDVFRALIKK